MTTTRLSGVLAPVVTPFTPTLAPDAARFVRHCRWLLGHGCRGLAVFGTNSEANSLSVDERMELLEALVDGGVPPGPDAGYGLLRAHRLGAAHRTRREARLRGALMLPPFYYKGVPDEGLFRNFAESSSALPTRGCESTSTTSRPSRRCRSLSP